MQNKRPLIIGIGVVLALILFVLMAWFWSLGAVASEAVDKARVEPVAQPIEYRRSADAEWKPLEGALELLDGDHVRTGKGGRANIRWGSQGITRLDPETELVIERGELGADGSAPFVIRLKLEGGRIWSRVLKILDVGGTMQVETEDVVATVRGTAFGVGKNVSTTEAAVTESVVSAGKSLLKEGQWGLFNASGTAVIVRNLTPKDAWAEDNRKLDELFDRELLQELEARLHTRADGRETASPWFLKLSEELHLVLLAGEKKRELAARYASRHAALALVKAGGSEADLSAAVRFGQLAGSRASLAAQPVHALASLEASNRLTQGERSDMSPRVLLLRDLRADILGQEAASVWLLKAVRLNEAIDDYVFGPEAEQSKTRERELLLELAALAGEVNGLEGVDTGQRTDFLSRVDAMGYRLGLEASPEPSSIDETPIEPALSPDFPQKLAPPTPPDQQYQQFLLVATPTNTQVGGRVRLTLYGATSEGQSSDLTGQAKFSVASVNDGRFDGNYFIPVKAGSIIVMASYSDAQGTRTASATITVAP